MRDWLSTRILLLTMIAVPAFSRTCVGQEESTGQSSRKVVSRIPPSYPELAKKMNVTGAVRVIAVVAPNGKVIHTEVIGGSPLLVQAAENAVYKSKWAASPGETRETIEIKFKPDQADQ